MVALRLDARRTSRVEASDIVREAPTDAAQTLADSARERPSPFDPRPHRVAAERPVQAHRRPLWSQARGVGGEERAAFTLPGGSTRRFADRLVAGDTSLGYASVREGRRQRLLAPMHRRATPGRENLVVRSLDDPAFPEDAAILHIGEGAATMRLFGALPRMCGLMEERDGPEPGP